MTFGNKSLVYDHVRRCHQEKKPVKCDFCPKTFTALGNMKAHRKTYHDKNTKNLTYKCIFCSKIFTSEISMNKHIKKFHNDVKL